MTPTIHDPPARSFPGNSLVLAAGMLASLFLPVAALAQQPPEQAVPLATPPPGPQTSTSATKPEILELSVSNDTRVSALVVWSHPGGKLTATQISKKFSFEWLRIPEGAESF